MAGKINRQVKSGKPILVNGVWAHQTFDTRPPSKATMDRMTADATRLGLRSA
jgi:hypothetical protein